MCLLGSVIVNLCGVCI